MRWSVATSSGKGATAVGGKLTAAGSGTLIPI
jgi:hypothetical protein